MRRLDDGHVQRPPPFRVLAPTDATHHLTAPPPARAPEPYKIAPSTASLSRAHRRSSFVIIAESRPATPGSRSPSPTLATGRASPFRGRGFKGPPPRSKSRPQSPETADGRKRGKSDRRASVSQQNSPRRSLIPQPTRQRSTSLSKANDRSSSPKIGRRVDSRNRLNASESRNRLNSSSNNSSITNLSTRRQVTKPSSRLSPIQGTPTKPEKTVPQYARRDRFNDSTRSSPTKIAKSSMQSPSKNASNNPRRANQERNAGRERLTSPSKIPLKASKNGTISLNPARFITIPDQPSENAGKKNGRESKGSRREDEQGKGASKTANRFVGNSKESQSSEKNSSSAEKSKELDLINLLKQSSGATGTSSVVNTTATTAVQPLHIDANAVLVESDGPERRIPSDQSKGRPDTSTSKSPSVPASNEDSSAVRKLQNGKSVDQDQQQRPSNNTQASSKSSKPSSNHNRPRPTDSRNDSPVPLENIGGHSKSSSISQSVKNFSKVNGTPSGTGSATQRANKTQNAIQANDQNPKPVKSIDPKTTDDRSTSGQPAPSASLSKSNEAESTNQATKNSSGATANGEKAVGSASTKTVDVRIVSRGNSEMDARIASTTSSTMTTANSTVANQVTTSTKANSVPVNAAVGAVNNSQNVNSASGRVRNDNRDSNVSLKSSTGVSTDSIESVRSTDTGVSVNTVRGVSSPREKTGMHVVKRPQEIETLSGNVMHLEQNGEPAVLEASTVDGAVPERFLARCKRSFSRYCKCCPSMRCLACRTDPKGFLWARNQSKVTTTRNEPSGQPTTDPTAETIGCWPRFKNRCRCNRTREMKCCSRRSRVAPAEGAACCPPERRFGAVCRRLFDRCKCKRNEAERTRSIRAKHSLTSVVPPPLSEEPKCKIPDVLVEHNSLMRGAIPCLPVPLAWFCLVWNILLPGSGTVWSGLFNLCTGQPRFSPVASLKSRLGAFVVNLVVGVGQLFTVLFCLVGWGWSIWWGVTLIRLARKYRRFKASEAANNDPEARGGDPAALPPGVPSQALRGMERAR